MKSLEKKHFKLVDLEEEKKTTLIFSGKITFLAFSDRPDIPKLQSRLFVTFSTIFDVGWSRSSFSGAEGT